MKVKLLKKVRKRFQIIHMPNGYVNSDGTHYCNNLFKLIDNTLPYSDIFAELVSTSVTEKQYCCSNEIFNSENECINYLKRKIIIRLRGDGYRGRKDYKIICDSKKIWWIK